MHVYYVCVWRTLRACAAVLDGPATYLQPVSTHAALLFRQGEALQLHTLWGRTPDPNAACCLQAVRALRFCAGDLPAAAAFAADERARARARRAQQRREAALRREQVMCAPGQHGCHGPCAACCGARSQMWTA